MARKNDDEITVKQAAEIIGRLIDEHGFLSVAALAEKAAELGVTHDVLHQSVRLLDRRKAITARKGPGGESGWESLLGSGRSAKRYGALSEPVRIRMVFITAPLGQISKDGEHFSLLCDEKGQVIFTPAGFRAMLKKAYRQSGLAGNESMSEASVHRISIQFEGVKETGRVPVTRRPVNRQRVAVGELLHEGLAPGSTADWTLAFPLTHFTQEQADTLLSAAQHVGFSPAGSGESGGNHGLFRWVKPE
jgi:hypothetical protein